MSPRSVRFGLSILVLSLGCASADAVAEDDDPNASDDALTSADSPPKRETHFASGDVDLTKYRSAGPEEWTAFEKFYRSRHTRPKERDSWEQLTERTKQVAPTNVQAELVNFVALKGYTLETIWFITSNPRIEQDYKLINTALRSVDANPSSAEARSSLAKVEAYVKAAASAVNAYPTVGGTVHRRVYRSKCDAACVASWLEPYKDGKFVREPSFLSTSEQEEATCFFRGQVHFVIASNGLAHSVKTLADIPTEEEAIFAPGTVFKVERVERDKPVVCAMRDGWGPAVGATGATLKPPPKETVVHLSAVLD
jgi:hypothetical protein